MTRVHESLSDPGFTVPDSIETADVCRTSGKLPVSGVCSSDPRGTAVYTEYFAKGTVPAETCDHHTRVTICSASGASRLPSARRTSRFPRQLWSFRKTAEKRTIPASPCRASARFWTSSSTIIHPSESADFSALGYSPDSDNLSAPIHSVVPRPMTGSFRDRK